MNYFPSKRCCYIWWTFSFALFLSDGFFTQLLAISVVMEYRSGRAPLQSAVARRVCAFKILSVVKQFFFSWNQKCAVLVRVSRLGACAHRRGGRRRKVVVGRCFLRFRVFGFGLDHVERSSDPFKTSSKVDYYCCFSWSSSLVFPKFPRLNPHLHPHLGPWRPAWCIVPMGTPRIATCRWTTGCTTATTLRPRLRITLPTLTIHTYIMPCHPLTTPPWEQPRLPPIMGWNAVPKVPAWTWCLLLGAGPVMTTRDPCTTSNPPWRGQIGPELEEGRLTKEVEKALRLAKRPKDVWKLRWNSSITNWDVTPRFQRGRRASWKR